MAKDVKVHCTIDTCHYWRQGHVCDASEILVTADSMAAAAPDRVDAPMASTLTATPTENCMQTCCKTFVSTRSYDSVKRADGVRAQ